MMIYSGVLDLKKMGQPEKRAYEIYRKQKLRCTDKNQKCFKHYGAKGISVEYGPREFISWWIRNQENLNLQNPNVGRKDHNKKYSFDNIEMIEKSENIKERNNRLGNPRPPRPISCFDLENNFIKNFASSHHAAKELGLRQGGVWRASVHGYVVGGKYRFRQGVYNGEANK